MPASDGDIGACAQANGRHEDVDLMALEDAGFCGGDGMVDDVSNLDLEPTWTTKPRSRPSAAKFDAVANCPKGQRKVTH